MRLVRALSASVCLPVTQHVKKLTKSFQCVCMSASYSACQEVNQILSVPYMPRSSSVCLPVTQLHVKKLTKSLQCVCMSASYLACQEVSQILAVRLYVCQLLTLADFLGGAGGAHPPTSFVHPPNMFCTPPNIYLHPPPPNIFAPYPRNYSIRGQAAYVPPNYSDHACFDISDALRYILGL